MLHRPVLLLVVMCVSEVLGMTAFATFPTLIPRFQAEWTLSNTEAGWIGGVYFGGYVIAVGILTAITDRVDPKRVYLTSMLVSLGAALGYGLAADGFVSASLWRCLQGIGLAGTYMPGLKALTDIAPARLRSRFVSFYTASFGVGASVSIFLAGWLEPSIGWRHVFIVCAAGPALAFLLVWVVLPAKAAGAWSASRWLNFRPVFSNRPALGFTLGYAAHNAELFGFRTWVVAFLVFSQSMQSEGAIGLLYSAATIAAIINLAGLPASIITNEIAGRCGRVATLVVAMSLSAGVAVALGFSATAPFWWVLLLLVMYGFMITADSATLTAGLVDAAEPSYRGATMAVHSMLGFVGSFIGPVVFGLVLDLAGGESKSSAWGMAFTAMALTVLLGPVALLALCRPRLQ